MKLKWYHWSGGGPPGYGNRPFIALSLREASMVWQVDYCARVMRQMGCDGWLGWQR